jgi:hypothetical protein
MKRILVLGGSYLQSDFINTAVNLGNEVFVLDKDINCYMSKCDKIKFDLVDISDLEKVNSYFVTNKCDFVISPVTEIGNYISACVSERHGLRYNTIKTVKSTTNKKIMREALLTSSLHEPKVLEYILGEGIPNGMSFPFIVKPSVSSASRGVSLVRTENEFYVAIESASKYVKEGEAILLEEYIRGEQFSIETISFNGKHIVLALVKEIISEAPFFMERIDIIDAGLNMGLKNQIVEFSSNLLSILNIQYGPCHIEVKIEGSQIRLIEIASRSGLLRDRLINTALGMNYNKLIIDSYNGNDVAGIDNFLPKTNALMGIILYPQDQEVFEELKLAGNISDYHLNGNSFSETPTMLTDAVGYFFTRNDIVDDLYNIQLRL